MISPHSRDDSPTSRRFAARSLSKRELYSESFLTADTGTPGPGISEFTVYRFPLEYPDAPGFNAPNTPAPEIIFADPDNDRVIHGNNRDAHGMTVTRHGKYLHQFDRVRNNVEVFNTKHLTRYTYWLTTADGKTPAQSAPLGTACGTTLGATSSNDPTHPICWIWTRRASASMSPCAVRFRSR